MGGEERGAAEGRRMGKQRDNQRGERGNTRPEGLAHIHHNVRDNILLTDW